MDSIRLDGGNELSGEVVVGGAKNASLLMLAAALLTEEECILRRVPNLRDINFFIDLLRHIGVEVEWLENGVLRMKASRIKPNAPYDLVRQMRASVCLFGPMIARLGEATLSLPGGCVIGNRPIDLHLNGFKKMGCDIQLIGGDVHVDAKNLRGAHIFLGGRFGSTVTGTANIIMAAVLAPDTTFIESAACEPEIVDLCNLLKSMGAQIYGIGSPCITIRGVKKLSGFDYTVIGDRIEAGTFIIAGLITNGNVKVSGFNSRHLGSLIHILENLGAELVIEKDSITTLPCLEKLQPFELTTLPYPGFPTDIQAQMCVLATQIQGLSLITERVYPNRFMHLPELQRLGAQTTLEGSTAIIQGASPLSGAEIMASDLRASAALYLAGLAAKGQTTVHRVYHVDRGYEQFDKKLLNLGATLSRFE